MWHELLMSQFGALRWSFTRSDSSFTVICTWSIVHYSSRVLDCHRSLQLFANMKCECIIFRKLFENFLSLHFIIRCADLCRKVYICIYPLLQKSWFFFSEATLKKAEKITKTQVLQTDCPKSFTLFILSNVACTV